MTKAVNEIKAGKVEYRLDKTNIIHCPIGKVSFGSEKLAENFNAMMGAIIKAKPAAAKGQYIKSCTVASTMGPGVQCECCQAGVSAAVLPKGVSPELGGTPFYFHIRRLPFPFHLEFLKSFIDK